ncbi:glycosyl hydrolase family 18 protein [Zobellia galactanivorans]|uniref:glycosyl hydrolase family 18 protein n=1 Tax=Zobellia galactanivorans (strain DSM 12802 / CCUG 47099 / CIP 106680 / NCIMB 13871 / Dsij) TaxID=63186 RepID=UPI001C07379A|nr:glycosyl hydrolase family 18 protein [Zobellia galactanivorans]MBU3027923.1 hypothetical protein [Zobellia galactanivorans]
MKTIYIKKLFFLIILLGSVILIISCSDDTNYSSPDLVLVTSNIETELNLRVDEEVILSLDFENAVGQLSYIWSIDGTIVSKDDNYAFQPTESGQFSIDVYVEDAEGKYTNEIFILKVVGLPHVFDSNKVVVGYCPSYKTDTIEWDKITHLIYTYVYPKEDGTLDTSDMHALASYVTQAKANNVKILVSIGGFGFYPGRDTRIFTNVIGDDTKRSKLVQNINTFIRDNQLDGIDINYQELIGGGETVDNTETNKLLPFFRELREALPSESLITSYVTGSYEWAAYHFRDITAEMASVLDFISVMSFDNLGSWPESALGPHSSITDAQNALNRYIEFGAPKSKLVLGLPLYGRDFLTASGGVAQVITYADIVSLYSPTESEFMEGNVNRDGHNIFFDSQEIVSQKVNYVKDNEFRGITLWKLGQDTSDPNLSLLKDILNQFN